MNQNASRDPIDAMTSGFRAAQVVFTANRLGVFPAIYEGTDSVEDLAEFLGASPRGVRILCDALAALGLLEKENHQYRLSPLALEYMLPHSPQSRVAMLLHGAKTYEKWGRLYDAVKTGAKTPDESIDPRLVEDDGSFARAMADVARASAPQLVQILDLSQTRRMLDLGGGPGFYAIECARANPGLHAVVFDSEQTLETAQINIEQAGLSDRVTVQPGDAIHDDFGEGYDFILLSNFIHVFSYECNRGVVQKCARALNPGGRLCVKDFLLDSDRTSPEWNALFAVNMLVGTDEGDCYTLEEVREWMEQAGLAVESVQPMAAYSKMILAVK